jgi:hypothetical protein
VCVHPSSTSESYLPRLHSSEHNEVTGSEQDGTTPRRMVREPIASAEATLFGRCRALKQKVLCLGVPVVFQRKLGGMNVMVKNNWNS